MYSIQILKSYQQGAERAQGDREEPGSAEHGQRTGRNHPNRTFGLHGRRSADWGSWAPKVLKEGGGRGITINSYRCSCNCHLGKKPSLRRRNPPVAVIQEPKKGGLYTGKKNFRAYKFNQWFTPIPKERGGGAKGGCLSRCKREKAGHAAASGGSNIGLVARQAGDTTLRIGGKDLKEPRTGP